MKNNMIFILGLIEKRIWIVATVLIVALGLYFSFKLKFIQFNIKGMYNSANKKEESNGGISSFKTLMLSLAGRIGVGSISGVALAIYVGGPGTIFWIWCISILSSTLAYAETYLGVKYKEKDRGKIYKGGPAYYLKNALKMPRLGGLYAIMIVLCYGIGFMSIQSNTITKAVTNTIGVNAIFVGIVLSIISFCIIFGGIEKITNTTSKLVPIMSVVYIVISFYVVLANIQIVPNIFETIVKSAFNMKSITASFIPTLLIGVQRGIFSNEAGIGTGSIAAASGESNDPVAQGYVQMIGIYITSFLICTSTAIIVLTSNYGILKIDDPNGIEIATNAFTYHLGDMGNIILVVSIFLFAFSTILSGYYYGESSLKYFFKTVDKRIIIVLKLVCVVVIFTGSITSPTLIWKFTDVLVAFLSLINIYALFKLRKDVKR